MKYVLMTLVSLACFGCGSAGETKTDSDSPAGAPPAAASATATRTRSTANESPRQERAVLAENEVRVPLFVVPGDANVEVDDVLVRRRNGTVELVGKVGDEHRVRVFAGSALPYEKIVKIEATGASPSTIDVRTSPVGK